MYQNRYAQKIVSRRMGLGPLTDFVKTAYLVDVINLANCATPDGVFNTGVPLCDVKKKKIKGLIFLDRGVSFSGGDVATIASFIAKVKERTTAARGSRVYPMFDLLNFEDNTGDPATGGVGNLTSATIVTSDASPAFRFGYNGTEARHKKMSAMNSSTLDIMFVDEGWTVYGTENGNGGIKGFNVLQAYSDVSRFVVSDAVNQYAFRITLGSITEYRDQSLYIVANSGLSSALGLINAQLSKLSNVTNVFKIKVVAEGGTDLEPLYGAALAGLPFTATNLETGAAVTVTSVADDTALDALTVTLDNAAYTAMAVGTRIQLSGPISAALAAAGIKPFEIFPVILIK